MSMCIHNNSNKNNCCISGANVSHKTTIAKQILSVIRNDDFEEFLIILRSKPDLNVFINGQTALHYCLLFGKLYFFLLYFKTKTQTKSQILLSASKAMSQTTRKLLVWFLLSVIKWKTKYFVFHSNLSLPLLLSLPLPLSSLSPPFPSFCTTFQDYEELKKDFSLKGFRSFQTLLEIWLTSETI